MITRRSAVGLFAGTAIATTLGGHAYAADKVIKIGINFSLTGGDAESAARMRDGALMAIDEANAKGTVKGYKLEAVVLDDATATAGQYDPAQAATNARKFVSDKLVVGAVGPQMSGAGKAMAPILSQGGLAIITPASTNPDLTDPKFAAQYRPAGKPVYFRTVTTDAYQGPNMADFMATKLGVKAIYILDDQGAYGVGMADAFQKRIAEKGVKVLGRDQLDPKAADYSAILTKIKSMNADSLYYGGVGTAGVKLVKQSYDILPNIKKAGGDGLYGGDLLKGAGFPAMDGWYATIAAPHMTEDTKLSTWMAAFKKKYGAAPEDYSITSYDAATIIIECIRALAAAGKPVTREAVRDAIQVGKFKTLQGEITYDTNGDVNSKIVSVFQVKQDDKQPLDDVAAQFKYIGVAPQS
ncbi:branched-chain amino acid ABC transporter substrate-binding protein [Acidisphaera sp. L21]|uniref:branched-chain amino acid ABC transporter substrate-binding protein n=1 Tax=Acidisphaera sp. L21 TaxID=1641851 RepID=UPI00131D935F|nr:branched-chain amino acid ABC transporter substrate-binding protein [Acidisphaera sp. L21]